MTDKSQPLDNLLTRQASDTFVGREDEIMALGALLEEGGPVVAHLYGIAGVGKSTLLTHFAARARQDGAKVLLMDCRLIEPTARGFLRELGQLTGNRISNLDDVVEMLQANRDTFILGLDHYETFLLMDTWLRQTLLPALPDTFRLVFASRQPPVPLWLTSPSWHGLFRATVVEPLGQAASLELLKYSGLDHARAEPLAAATQGNPLALKLAASASLAQGTVTFSDAAIQEVMQKLTALFLADVEDSTTRDAVRFLSVTRRITRSLLRALSLADEEIFENLQRLPFIEAWRDGLRIHDAVREPVARTLRAEDPERYSECRRQVWLQLRKELGFAPRADFWRYTADMLYLIENPAVREAFFPSGQQEFAVEPARPEDHAEIRGITDLHEGPMAVAALDGWLAENPEAFRVVRNREGGVVAFYCMCMSDELIDSQRLEDPVADAWCRHLEEQPVSEGDRVLFLRRWLSRGIGEAPSAEQAACWLDVKRVYMESRPALRRVYLTVVDLPTYAPVATQLGFRHIASGTVTFDGTSYQTAMLDFGPNSVDGWITGLVGEELGMGDHGPLDHDRRALKIADQEIALTPLEFNLAEYLQSQLGATVTRDQLLDHVWGYSDVSGSSNVVDAVVKSLRRKLGDEAGLVETVRGFGYRWRKD